MIEKLRQNVILSCKMLVFFGFIELFYSREVKIDIDPNFKKILYF